MAQFGRSIFLLLNRSTLYDTNHPYVQQSIDSVYPSLQELLNAVSPLVFILNRDQFFIDEERLDPRINVSKIVAAFKKVGLQSISFEKGVAKNDLNHFLDIFSSPQQYAGAEEMKKALFGKGVRHLKINHVFYKKVTENDEVVSRDALKKVTPHLQGEDERGSKKMFLDMVLQSVMAEEFEKTLTVRNLVNAPAKISKKMVEADLISYEKSDAEDKSRGDVLLHQLQMIKGEVEKNLSGAEQVNLSDLAEAVFDMKRQLKREIEEQKAIEAAFANEDKVINEINEITDNVLIQLVKDEYKAGKVTISRMSQILRRLVPEPDELKRLLPKIKEALLAEGMELSEYLDMVGELKKELQNEGLTKTIREASEEVGIDGDTLIQEITKNPEQAAELIFLAAEMSKGTGDEKVLTDILVEYVERLGNKLTRHIARDGGEEGEHRLRKAMTGVEANIVNRLRGLDLGGDALERLEDRINQRMEELLGRFTGDWIQSQAGQPDEDSATDLSVLQILEHSVTENDELAEILKTIRTKVESQEVDENDFAKIYAEIVKEKQERIDKEAKRKLPTGVLKTGALLFWVQKEISRAKRYDIPFSALGFSVVKATPTGETDSGTISQQSLMDEICFKLSKIFRDADIVGQLGKNTMVALLPMTPPSEAKLALQRCMKLLNLEKLGVDGISLTVKIAGVAREYDQERTPTAEAFVKALATDLRDMVVRIKNIHALF
jgi:hypothetical protein